MLNLFAVYLSSCQMSKNECVFFNLMGMNDISHFGSFHFNTIARINVDNVPFRILQIYLPFLWSLSCSCFICHAMAVLCSCLVRFRHINHLGLGLGKR